MPQGKYKKTLTKRVRKGQKGYPLATVAFYGPDNTRASKVVCSIIAHEDADSELMRKWFTNGDARTSETILGELLASIEERGARSVAMAETLLGCPHEEGIDYPRGESCPHCPYWKHRDRFSHERLR
jgi:hypothetical protein